MENHTILICITFLLSLFIIFFSEDKIYKSHKISPVSGEPTKVVVCIQDPYFNTGFIMSLKSIDEIKEIQESLKKADKKYIIREEMGDFLLINNIHKREQIIKKCSYKIIKNLMEKNKTSLVDYSV
jgi:hypothetical protein